MQNDLECLKNDPSATSNLSFQVGADLKFIVVICRFNVSPSDKYLN